MFAQQQNLYTRIARLIATALAAITLAIGLILYYWCFYTYDKTFEDYRIDQKTTEDTLKRGVKNEWILGVSAHSVDLLEAIHGDKTAEHILKQAEQQVENTKVYREKVDGKYLIYRIDVDMENGEKIYRYSVVKDIYLEHLPSMIASMAVIVICVYIITQYVIIKITSNMSKTIRSTSKSIQKMAYTDASIEINTDNISDPDLLELVKSYQYTKQQLDEQYKIQQDSLQYISHELKTPIMIIKTYAQSAKDKIYPKGDIDSTLDVIINQTNRMQYRVSDLMLVSKIDVNYFNEEPKEINLSEVIRQTSNSILGLRFDRDVTFDLDESLTIEAQDAQIRVLIENMLMNQKKYSKSYIYIKAEKDNEYAHLTFKNDADALPQDIQEHIFDPFVKGESGNTGLGLAIIKRIVNLHKGRIELNCTDDTVTFDVFLPIHDKVYH